MKNIAIAKVILIITFFVSSVYSYSQTISFNELNDYVQDVRIGLVDEFFDRFNGKTTNPDIPKTKPDSRMKNLMMLFDLSQFSSKNDPRFVEAEALMKIVKEDSICINYADSTWAALAHCKGTLNGKSVKFDIFLTVQHRKANMYKWVISYVDGNLFDITPRNINDRIMLLPDDHETNFLSLKRMTSEQPFNINQFMVNGFNYEKTSAFVYLVYSKLLKIDYVDDLEFIFTQVPGYIFHVKYFYFFRRVVGDADPYGEAVRLFGLRNAEDSFSRLPPRSVLLSLRSEVATGNPHPYGEILVDLRANTVRSYGKAVGMRWRAQGYDIETAQWAKIGGRNWGYKFYGCEGFKSAARQGRI